MRARVLFALTLLCASSARATLGLYADPEGTNCAINIPVGTSGTFYLIWRPEFNLPSIYQGTLLTISRLDRRAGFPVDKYTMTAIPGPAVAESNGSPQTLASFKLAECMGEPQVLLYTLIITNLSDTESWRVVTPRADVYRCDGARFGQAITQSTVNFVPGSVAAYPQPADLATNVSANLSTIRWAGGEGSHPCTGPSSGVSDVYFGTSSNPPLIGTTNRSDIVISPQPLMTATTYYWRVETVTLPAGTRVWSPTWQFTTAPATSGCAFACTEPAACPSGCILGHCVTEVAADISDTEECGIGGPATNTGGFNRRTGHASASSGYCFDGATSSSATAIDRFWIAGPPTPEPINFNVVFQCSGSGVGRLRVDGFAEGQFFFGTRTFTLPVSRLVDQQFEVEYHVTGAPWTQTGSGSMFGQLRFEGLPPGYTPFSCWGFGSSVGIEAQTWSNVKSRYR